MCIRDRYDCIRACTITPAQAISRPELGSLAIGTVADVAVFEVCPVSVQLEDCQSQLRECTSRVVARAVWVAGEAAPVSAPEAWPNAAAVVANSVAWHKLEVRDAEPPAALLEAAEGEGGHDTAKSGDWNPGVSMQWREEQAFAKLKKDALSMGCCC
eukprot:TRINITY_DN13262_c0_g1_i2.p2 TRINITY_DN13262_c0_g1~~TRINITY_DN13262_c0_g1_i2.p2  ORF type:complete len:157 (+),score=55.17 TRINITY_DN13262_c0_g1_i2:73-543(+)